MQPHGRGGAKSEEDPVVDAILPEGCLPQIVEGALRRMHQMGARVILDPLDAIKDVLHSTICGFKYSDVVVALQRQFPGGKGRFTLVECKSRGGLD